MPRIGLLCLNEVNFDLVREYISQQPDRFINFERLFDNGVLETTSENDYELLEPWIQWLSVQTAKNFEQHRIFRLGDIIEYPGQQIYESLEATGASVGAVSPMNAENRLSKPHYFIPDPWTKTHCDAPWLGKKLFKAIKQAVNDNSSSKITYSSRFFLLLGLFFFSRPKAYGRYFKILRQSKKTPGCKALFLDALLHELHLNLYRRYRPDFSQLFLNAFAHIQHHYFFHSKTSLVNETLKIKASSYQDISQDPFPFAIEIYDAIIGDFIEVFGEDTVIATGLRQVPYNRLKFYYRLRSHERFLREQIKLHFVSVLPLMTRDFVINFENKRQASAAEAILRQVTVLGIKEPLFGEIDNRGNSLFITLNYANEITEQTMLTCPNLKQPIRIKPHIVFVALKNGMHDATGYLYLNSLKKRQNFKNFGHVKELGSWIVNCFTENKAFLDDEKTQESLRSKA